MKHLKKFSIFESQDSKIPSKKEVDAVLKQFDEKEKTAIESVLANDENSTDEELAEYFTKEFNFEPDTIAEILSIRGYFLSGQDLRDAIADLPAKDKLPKVD